MKTRKGKQVSERELKRFIEYLQARAKGGRTIRAMVKTKFSDPVALLKELDRRGYRIRREFKFIDGRTWKGYGVVVYYEGGNES